VVTLTGVVGESGFNDDPAAEALFNSTYAVVLEADGGVLFVDISNASIRRVKDGMVTTVATAAISNFAMPIDMMAVGDRGYLIADINNHCTVAVKLWSFSEGSLTGQ
jgi:hypothetical protein